MKLNLHLSLFFQQWLLFQKSLFHLFAWNKNVISCASNDNFYHHKTWQIKENNSSMKKNKLNLADLNLPSCFTSLKRLSPFMLATFFVVNVVLSIKLSKLINKSHGNGLCFKREITTCSPKKSIWSNTTYTWPIFQGDV